MVEQRAKDSELYEDELQKRGLYHSFYMLLFTITLLITYYFTLLFIKFGALNGYFNNIHCVLDLNVERLEKELENANDLLEAARRRGHLGISDETVETLSPSAAATSRLLKSGMTLTQVSKVVQL